MKQGRSDRTNKGSELDTVGHFPPDLLVVTFREKKFFLKYRFPKFQGLKRSFGKL